MSLPDKALAQLHEHEGEVLHLYYDTRGVPTIGSGINLREGRIPDDLARQITITSEASQALFALRVRDAERDLAMFLPWANSLDEVRRSVLVMLIFNLGAGGLIRKNPKMLAACEAGDYAEAARELLDGPWKHQVGQRAFTLAKELETGQWA